jgi:DNA-binding HxlR family transcriptional regulator
MVTNAPSIQGDVLDANCPSRYALDLIADKWTPLVISLLGDGTLRYGHLKRRIGGISQKMLTQTLRKLESEGLITRKIHATVPPMVEYTLTPLGESLVEPLSAMLRWSETPYHEMHSFRAHQTAEQAAHST